MEDSEKFRKLFQSRIAGSFLILILAVTLFFMRDVRIPYADEVTDRYFEDTITKAGVTYGACAVINSTVSMVKESELELQPAGVGLSLSVGQVLDPVDDLVERLSDLLITAIMSLGLLKVLHEIFIFISPVIVSYILFILLILNITGTDFLHKFRSVLLKVMLIIIAVRFFLPVSALANKYLFDSFFEYKIEEIEGKLKIYDTGVQRSQNFTIPESQGIFDTISSGSAIIKNKAVQMSDTFMLFMRNIKDITKNLLNLTILYFSRFMFQVVILPLAAYFLLIKMINALFSVKLPYLIKHRPDTDKGKTA